MKGVFMGFAKSSVPSSSASTTIGSGIAQPKQVNKKITLAQLIGLSVAFFGSIRNVPQVALAGWSSVLWMGLTVIVFVIPMGFIAAELATGWSKRGGPEVWVKNAMGRRSGFIVAWLLWVQMFFGIVIVGVAFATMLAYGVGNPEISTPWMKGVHKLEDDPIYLMLAVIVIYWIITLMNIKSRKVGKSLVNVGSILGIYIPVIVITVCGIIFISQQAALGNTGAFGHIPDTFFPASSGAESSTNGFELFSQIMWIFIGLEIASTRANEIDNPKRNYPIALFTVLILMVVFNLTLGFISAALIPNDMIQLSDAIILPLVVIFESWELPGMVSLLGFLMAFGMFSQMNSWVLGPSNSMFASAREGCMPHFFHKKTKTDVPIVFVIAQATIISLLAGLYTGLTMAGLGNVYGILLNETIILYCIAYVYMIVSYIITKHKKLISSAGFVVPWGAKGAWIAAIFGLCAVILCVVMTFFQAQPTFEFTLIQNIGVYIGGTVVFLAFPFALSFTRGFRKMAWVNKQELAEAEALND